MSAGLKPYPAYKTSGEPWLGDVPEHWAMERAKWLFHKMDRAVRDQDEVVTCFRDGEVTLRRNRRILGFTESLQEIGYQGVRSGDLVIHAMDAFAGAVGVSDSDGKSTPVYSVCEPVSRANADYYARIVREMARTQWILALAKGIRERSTDFRFEAFSSQRVPVPTLSEQAVIVRFLDRVDRRVRRYMRAKQKLIKLLEEQKQVAIHEAVTGQIDVRTGEPYPAYRDSGISWLGTVPDHWEVLPARYLFRAVTRRDVRGDEVKLSVTQRHGLVPTDEMEEKSTQAMSYDRFQVCHRDDLILNKYKAHLGVFWAARMRGLITPNYTVFKPVRKLVTPFFEVLYHTRTYRDAFSMAVYGVTEGMSPLYTQDFYATPTCVPPQKEQEHIVSWIADGAERQNGAIARLEGEIALLHEYQTRLVLDVVTGKLDVREAAANLPDEAEEPEPPAEEDFLSDESDGDEAVGEDAALEGAEA
jgi:type I restriction enzyme S subunit